jgi:AsmA protein
MKSLLRPIGKILKICGITVGSILLILFLLPVVFPSYVNEKIKQWTNSAITGELNFSKVRLSFFNHFPSLTLTLYDVSLKGSAPFQKDTLVAGKEIALGVNLSSLFGKAVTIDEIYITDARLNVLVDKEGKPNYNIYNSPAGPSKKTTDTSSATLRLKRIQIDNCSLNYDDRAIPFLLVAQRLDYLGKGDLSKAVFDLTSHVKMEKLTVSYDKQNYLENKKIDAELITKINTSSLSFLFEDNNLSINQLPLEFKGRFDFLKNGYDMDLRFSTKETNFKNLFTALPPAFLTWVEKRNVKGDMTMDAALTGRFIAKENIAPSLVFNMKVEDGYFSSKKAKEPARNFFFDFHFKMPSLNTDSMSVDVDSVHLAIGDRFLQGAIHTKGYSKLYVDTHLKGELDIEKLNRIFGSPDSLELKGMYNFDLIAKGLYAKEQNPKRIRREMIMASTPAFILRSYLRDGYLKYHSLPEAARQISFTLDASCRDNNYRHTKMELDSLNANIANNFIKGFVHLDGLEDFPVDAYLKTKFNLAEIKAFYPLQDVDVSGNIYADIVVKGKYNLQQKMFPVANASLRVENGSLKTPYYPSPVSDIQVQAVVTSKSGSLKDLQVNLKPASLTFEGKNFTVVSELSDFENIAYSITSKGTLDIGKLYKVFGVRGYDVNGIVQTDFSLQGSQADAMAGRFSKLNNKGTLRLQNITLSSDLFPRPFTISTGVFHFDNDKLQADDLKVNYGSTGAVLKGYFTNFLDYTLKDSGTLNGHLEVNTPYLNVDELMAFSPDKTENSVKSNKTDTVNGSGVILIPSNLDLDITANAARVAYNGLSLADCKATVILKQGSLALNNAGFKIIEAPVNMSATYKSLSPNKATFSYHIDAKEFDVKKAYNEIPLFRQMASSASSAEGIVSLDYNLEGMLDKNMYPVLPSLKGGGVLSLTKVKIKGLKLFNAVSKAASKDSLNNPDLSKVDIKSRIANNIMTIERVKMRIFGFRPRFEGQVGLDGKLNLKGRIGLPPLGIIGIPFTVTGTQDEPLVKLRKARKGDELEEKDYDDDEEKEASQAVQKHNEEKKPGNR